MSKGMSGREVLFDLGTFFVMMVILPLTEF